MAAGRRGKGGYSEHARRPCRATAPQAQALKHERASGQGLRTSVRSDKRLKLGTGGLVQLEGKHGLIASGNPWKSEGNTVSVVSVRSNLCATLTPERQTRRAADAVELGLGAGDEAPSAWSAESMRATDAGTMAGVPLSGFFGLPPLLPPLLATVALFGCSDLLGLGGGF